jgi:hypothetical protein
LLFELHDGERVEQVPVGSARDGHGVELAARAEVRLANDDPRRRRGANTIID